MKGLYCANCKAIVDVQPSNIFKAVGKCEKCGMAQVWPHSIHDIDEKQGKKVPIISTIEERSL